MNVILLDPFEVTLPQDITASLTCDYHINVLKFNRRGTQLATGSQEGTICIWDMDTLGISMELKGHVQPITSLSFSRCGKFLLSSSRDWNVILWDLKSKSRMDTIRFTSAVQLAIIHPRKNSFIVLAHMDSPCLFVQEESQDMDWKKVILETPEPRKDTPTTIQYHPSGKYILVGTNKGFLLTFTEHGEYIKEQRISSSSIKQIQFNTSGREVLINSLDRIIRVFGVKDTTLQNEQKFLDAIDRMQWSKCHFSADGEYIAASTMSFIKMLEGPQEGMSDMTWHPTRPLIASVSNYYGHVNLWQHIPTQKFSSFEPLFTELDDNIEYIEEEDEYDIKERVIEKKNVYEEADVDIVQDDLVKLMSDTDDED
ncbi:chromatin binding protein [Boothiomyces macroporosus]|uniref:Chromatin binding protein n=1 Tax=Boothiomyces macroporosus TaxID=261099 RepID=A0AAD5ULH2_9FUNG|nr:chromatin binding protein [Boothiomyces macroporosus]